MKQRGRKSAAKLAVIESANVVERPKAPESLSKTEAALWDEITKSRGPGFFDVATVPLLTEYCRLQTQVDTIGAQLGEIDKSWLTDDEFLKRYKVLTGIRDQGQGRQIALARSMRLTQQSRYQPDVKTNKPAPAAEKIWQRG